MRPIIATDLCVLFQGDSLRLIDVIPEGYIDAIVTDPPYELGFMGKGWDASGIAYNVDLWRAVYRVLKPGGYLLAFGGTRTYHRMTCAIEDAGFEIRDSLHWLYGSGFPKSVNVGRQIDMHLCELPGRHYDKALPSGAKARPGDHRCPAHPAGNPYRDHGSALKPAHEPIVMARKPLDGTIAVTVLAHGTGSIDIGSCRIGTEERFNPPAGNDGTSPASLAPVNVSGYEGQEVTGRWPSNVLLSHLDECEEVGTRVEQVAQNVDVAAEGGNNNGMLVGAVDVMSIVYDCAPGCAVAELDEQSGISRSQPNPGPRGRRGGGFGDVGADRGDPVPNGPQYDDIGGASRFFYCAKPNGKERDFGLDHLPVRSGGEVTDRTDGSAGLKSPRAGAGRGGGRRNTHPTVKPIALMRYLCRLVTPRGGIILDPFAGSGTTGIAALREGFSFVGVELGGENGEHIPIIAGRLNAALAETRKGLT